MASFGQSINIYFKRIEKLMNLWLSINIVTTTCSKFDNIIEGYRVGQCSFFGRWTCFDKNNVLLHFFLLIRATFQDITYAKKKPVFQVASLRALRAPLKVDTRHRRNGYP